VTVIIRLATICRLNVYTFKWCRPQL